MTVFRILDKMHNFLRIKAFGQIYFCHDILNFLNNYNNIIMQLFIFMCVTRKHTHTFSHKYIYTFVNTHTDILHIYVYIYRHIYCFICVIFSKYLLHVKQTTEYSTKKIMVHSCCQEFKLYYCVTSETKRIQEGNSLNAMNKEC